MKHALIATTSLFALLLSGYSLADNDCTDPVTDWQPRETLRQQVQQQYSWSVQRIKVDDGCYKVKALDRKGNAVKATYAPASLVLRNLEIEFRDDDGASEYLGRPNHQP